VPDPDLFVVCKNCSSEVSPYVTECPYCGQRVRKRAPKIERAATADAPPKRSLRGPGRARGRPSAVRGMEPDVRPYATGALVLTSLLITLVLSTNRVFPGDLGGLVEPLTDDAWRLVTTAFVAPSNFGFVFITLLAVAIFGALLERDVGRAAPVVIFVLAGTAGAALAALLGDVPALGANGAALGLLAAWLVDDRRASARGDERENDLLGVGVIGVVLALLPLAEPAASGLAGAGGAATGAVVGLVLSLRPH
jgi:membrane associated rhomboid family serine protease